MRPKLPWHQKKNYEKRKFLANISDEYRCKNINKMLANQIQQYIKRIIHHDQVRLSQDARIVQYPQINVIQHINKRRDKKSTSSSQYVEIYLTKFNIHLWTLKVGIMITYPNIIKAIFDKPRTNIILNGEKLKSFYSKIRNKIRMSIHSYHPYLTLN